MDNFKFPFGKHKGRDISEVAVLDPEYLLWAQENVYENVSDAFIAELVATSPVWPDETPKEKARRRAWLRIRAIVLKGSGITGGEQIRIYAEEKAKIK